MKRLNRKGPNISQNPGIAPGYLLLVRGLSKLVMVSECANKSPQNHR